MLVGVFAWTGCSAVAPAPRETAYTLVWLKTHPRQEPMSKQASDQAFAGHFANMDRLWREGALLLAGPYGQQRSDAALRGIFVLDTADRATAKVIAETDPAYLAGVFKLEYSTLTTAANLREHRVATLAAYDAAVAAGNRPGPGDGARGFVLLTADDCERTAQVLAGNTAVLMFARLEGGRAFVLLDCPDMVAAVALLAPLAQQLGNYRLDEWFASGLLKDLPRRGDG